jgi:hypothetical protein
MSNYEFNEDKINDLSNQSEPTSAVSAISYEVENALANKDDKGDIKQQIVDLQDTNKFPSNLEFVDAFYDSDTSTSGVAFLDHNSGQVVVGFAGTNFDNGFFGEGSKDVGQWANIAFVGNGPSADYFNASHEFMTHLIDNGYTIDTVTGHSLGGRNGVIMGMAYSIPNIILYNSAPLMNPVTGIPTKNNLSNMKELEKLINHYKGKGNVIYFVSEDDPLNKIAGPTGSLYPGKIYVIKNGKAHDMSGFLTKEEQNFIRQHLPDEVKRKKELQTINKDTKKALSDLDVLRKKFLKGGGGLSSGQKIYLDAAEALALTSGMKRTLQVDISAIKKMYKEAIEDAGKLWQNTIKAGNSIGTLLSNSEVLGSLMSGGADEGRIKIIPTAEYTAKISELSSIEKEYDELIGKIKSSISKQLDTDRELAQLIRG